MVGALLTAAFAVYRSWSVLLPSEAVALGLSAALFIGVFAGLYPALRAARLAPTDALRAAG